MIEDLSVQNIKEQFKTNKNLRLTTFAVGGLGLLLAGYFLYKQFVSNPKNEKSKDSWYVGLNYAKVDSTDVAIDELNAQVKKFDGYMGGEIAQFVLARQYMAKGEFKKALEELEGVNVNDTYVAALTIGLQGDCYSEMNKYPEAYDLYMEAAEKNANEFTSPMYLMKAGLHAEELKNFENAVDCYQRIKDEYPAYATQKTIDKYLAKAKNKKVK